MVFLPDDHTLDTNITVANVAGLTMCGESSSGNRATIVCSGSVGLSFTSMVDFKIDSLSFTSCSRNGIPPASNYALLLQSTQHTELVNCSFHDNNGTALVVINTNITLAENSEFTHNHCESDHCAITALNSNLTFTGNITFLDNSATSATEFACGGAIYASFTLLSFNGTSNFINNSAHYGGAIQTWANTVLSFNGINNFINNSAFLGSAIYTHRNSVLSFSGANNFINNSARFGGAISTGDRILLNFNGISNFTSNSAGYGGGTIYTGSNNTLIFNGTNNFIKNSARFGGAIYTIDNTVLSFSGTSNFINNSAGDAGGAIFTYCNNTLTFNGTIYFTNNGQYGGEVDTLNGGGVFMGLQCTFSILPNTTVYWENNHASLGGAIYVHNASPISSCSSLATYVPKEECFFQLPDRNVSNGIDVQLVFKNNSADAAGSVLYGGAIDNCKLTHGLDSHSSGKVFDMIVHNNDTYYNTTSNISSDPLQICPCEIVFLDCIKVQSVYYDIPHTVYPGETFHVSVVAVGQRNGAVPSTVISSISKHFNPGDALHSQYLQRKANNTCTTLSYAVSSLSQYVYIDLHADGSPCNGKLHILVNLYQTCPPGFNISESEKSCVCEPRLVYYKLQCNITNGVGQITRDSDKKVWVSYDNQSDELIFHPLCPFDYCVTHTVVFSLNKTDIQCAYNRSGLLCGCCKKGYSLVLGTFQCKKCTNKHLYLLIPFAVMGVALVFLLFVCKLTVAMGTLSGLVFYANIVGVNRTVFLPVESTDAFSVFLAWLNLDFGIETCFYNGMDTYGKTWLQFVFPIYIWLLVGLVVLVSNFSHRFAKLLGNNPVPVLATLILLSYTKILRTLITVLYVTYLEYQTYNKSVWLYDANIDYLSAKHIPLFLVAVLVFFFLFLPYTILLLFGQWLQAISHLRLFSRVNSARLQVISHLRLFSWVNSARLKPFMDSYHAPYKAKHRYWPGLLLVLRFFLLLVFALNPLQDPNIKLLAILVGTGILVVWAWVCGGVYRNWCLDALEGSFVLNLIILAAATYYVKLSGENQFAVGYTSVSIAFATFIGILVVHLANMTDIAQYLKRKCTAVPLRNRAEADVDPQDDGSLPDRLVNPGEYEPPFHTTQGHATAEPTEEVNEAQRRLIPPYTYGSIN